MSLSVADPNVKIPAAIQASAARATEIHDQVYKKTPAEPGPGDSPPPQDPPAEPVVAAPPVMVTPEVTPPAEPAKSSPDTNWEHAYKSMKGRFDRAQQANAGMQERLAHLESIITTLQAAPPPAPAAAPASLLTPKDLEDYGPDLLDAAARAAQDKVNPEVTALKQQLAELERQVQGVGGEIKINAHQRMLSTLDEKLSSWREVNLQDEFLGWLQLPDAYSGAIRHDLLKAAWAANDAPRVLAFFKGFLSEEAAEVPGNGGPDLTEAPNNGAHKVPLETFAAPGRAKTAAPTPGPAEKPIITRAQITQFYTDSAAGKYRGREAEKERLEAMIFAAEREGRIR